MYFEGNIDNEKYCGHLYGLGTQHVQNGNDGGASQSPPVGGQAASSQQAAAPPASNNNNSPQGDADTPNADDGHDAPTK